LLAGSMIRSYSDAAKANRRAKKTYEENVAYDQARVNQELQTKTSLGPVREGAFLEWQKVDAILTKMYAANVIPSPFRNLYAVYYLFEYLSSSQETLQEAMLHCDLDEIKRKLDTIIQQNEQIILNQELQLSQIEEMRRQNDKIVRSAIATEKNTHTAAQYSQIAAANSEALVYMAAAQYIKQSF